MNTAIYLRKSRSDPDDESISETLARHKKTLLEFAKKNKLTITTLYEEVVSGDGLFVRPEMIRMLSDIEADKYDGVLCMDIDRLGRVDTKDRGIILDTFKTHRTKIITPRKIYDLNDEIDEFSTEIQMLMARQELKKITQRLQAGVKRTLEDGYHVGEPPYGYRRTYINKRPTLEICEEEARIVRLIFDMYVNEGIGSSIIADTINAMGCRTRKNTAFSRNTVRFFLQNPTYIGKIVWNKRKHIKKKHPDEKHRSELNPQSEWIVTDGVHPPIIDAELFEQAQRIRETRTHPPSNTGEIKNPFAGIIRCKNCGQLMSRQTSKKTGPRLLCVNNACNKSITIDKVEASVLKTLERALADFKIQVKTLSNAQNQQQLAAVNATILEVKKQISVLQQQKERLHDLLEQGVYDIATFTRRGKVIEENIHKLQTNLKKYQKQQKELDTLPTVNEIIPTLQRLVDNYENLSAKEKNDLMKGILDCIYYKRDKTPGSDFTIEIVFKQFI